MKELRPATIQQAEEDMIAMARKCGNNKRIAWLTADCVHSAAGYIWIFSPEYQMSSPNHQSHFESILSSTDSIGLRGVGEVEGFLLTIIERMPSDIHAPLMYYKSIFKVDPRVKFRVIRSKLLWWFIRKILPISELDRRRGSRIEFDRITKTA